MITSKFLIKKFVLKKNYQTMAIILSIETNYDETSVLIVKNRYVSS